jgi:hypothetical protein
VLGFGMAHEVGCEFLVVGEEGRQLHAGGCARGAR